MIRIVSWQRSGVAWAPWRVRRCLAGSSLVEMSITASHAGLESYGLPEVDEVLENVLDAARGADVVHLHHAYASDEVIPLLRDAYPRLRIVVTLHGEPDRGIGRVCANPPDAYHVVEPGLAAIVGDGVTKPRDVPFFFIPNHPATIDLVTTRVAARRPQRSLLVPFSNVPQWKDHDEARQVAALLKGHGWRVTWLEGKHSNAALLEVAALHDAVWVQMQGYLDILTMECWSLGVLPIVLHPARAHYPRISDAMGFAPMLPFTSRAPAEVVARLLDARTWDSVPVNRAGMAACWVPARARQLWERFYQGVVAGAASGQR
jgi:hypothetical protein